LENCNPHSLNWIFTHVDELNALKKSHKSFSHRRKVAMFLNTYYIVNNASQTRFQHQETKPHAGKEDGTKGN
jgi:hypothetical protein